jgi:hypothetical protein
MLPEIVMVPLSKLKDNPWRDKKRNPIDPSKVEQIAESIVSTGEFWIGVYGRKVAGGFVELAFGHHRADAAKAVDTGDVIEAAKSAGLKAIPVAIREFTDGEMLMRMTRENLRGELPVVLEAVSAAVRALAEGKIEIPAPDPSTQKSNLRYAPSFVPGRPSGSEPERPYTAASLARFLGGVYITKDRGKEAPSNSVKAALGILELEERKIEGFTQQVYVDKSIREIIPMVSDIKQRHVAQVERRGKTAAELEALRAKQLEAQAKAKADEKAAEEEREALFQKYSDARREENNRKADKAAEERKGADERAKLKEKLNKLRMAELDEKIAQKKAWEAEQRIQDAYSSIRRDVESMVGRLERTVEEHNPFRDEVKALAKLRKLKAEDRERLRQAALAVGEWYRGWVAAQFVPLVTEEQELAEMSKKEKSRQAKESK